MAESVANVLFDVLDKYFFFPLVESTDPIHLEDALRANAPRGSVELNNNSNTGCKGATQCDRAGWSINEVSSSAYFPTVLSPEQRAAFAEGRELYGLGLLGLKTRMSEEQAAAVDRAFRELHDITGGWARRAANLLSEISSADSNFIRSVRHCIVSRGQLIATLGKLVLFGLNDLVEPTDVYSASREPKLACFKMIAER